jgi:Uncharacterized protein conserved in bacteria
MNHLSSHLEILLLENDCVVIPEFGGFIAHNVPAKWNKEQNLFVPPARVIGFNPQLTMNDGLLIQSYMETYGIDYNYANKILQTEINEIRNILNNEGRIELPFIGEIKYSSDENYHFLPYEEKINSPALYGLDSFAIQDIKSLKRNHQSTELVIASPKRTYSINTAWKNVAAVAAAIVLFFLVSTPIENTYVEKQSYANVFPGELFEKIKNESLLITQAGTTQTKAPQQKTQPIAKADQNIPAKEIKVPKEGAVKEFHLIIASVRNEADAKNMVDKLLTKGYKGAKMITTDGKIRVSIATYKTKDEAKKELEELRKADSYKDAWMLEI